MGGWGWWWSAASSPPDPEPEAPVLRGRKVRVKGQTIEVATQAHLDGGRAKKKSRKDVLGEHVQMLAHVEDPGRSGDFEVRGEAGREQET